ncbi:MAG: glycosyltransferase [Planctomycetota bacterium]|jgi:glycosyltransferase involved in cell wall biosynthesis|nr:glycosyltransferase [Planctomycetota bacterium]
MTKIRVLQMPVANARGGITRYALQNARFIDRSRFVVDFATRSPWLDFADLLAGLGGKAHYFSCSSLEDERRFAGEMHRILDGGYDAVHLHTSYWNGQLAEKIASERGCPLVIVHAHSTMVDLADAGKRTAAIELHERLKREFSEQMANRFCACSAAAAAWLFGENIPGKKIRILKNAIDVAAFSFNPATRERTRRELRLSGKLVLGCVGRFTYQKNHEKLLDVFALVRDRLPTARLVLVGDGPLLDQARRDATGRGLDGDVAFLGRRGDVADLMQAMDVYLQPSRFEGLGLALVEAQAAGLRCLASEHVPPETGVTPELVRVSGDAGVWADAVLELAGGYDRRDGSGKVAAAGYSIRRQIGEIEKLYAGL